ncbi:MAG: hypothetical protein WBX15_15605 [Thermoanaerobaculia bacterium]
MKTPRGMAVLLAALLTTALAVSARSQEPPKPKEESEPPAATTKEPAKKTSPLVEAARESAAERGRAKIRIDNKAVKESKKNMTVLKKAPGENQKKNPKEEVPAEVAPPPEPQKDVKELREERFEAETRLRNAMADVESLETELRRLENDYYNSDDPDYRDGVLAKRYAQVEAQLRKARIEVIDAREVVQQLPPEQERSKSEDQKAQPPAAASGGR